MTMTNGNIFYVKKMGVNAEIIDSLVVVDDRDKLQLLADICRFYDDDATTNRIWDKDGRGVKIISKKGGCSYHVYYRSCGVVTQD